MNDLPVVLDAPVRRARPASSGAVSPWWAAPARLVGRFRPRIAAAAAADSAALRGLPAVFTAVGLPLIVIILAGVVSVTHATAVGVHASTHVDWLRLQVDDVFTESPVFLLAAIAVGAFSPTLGVFLVAVFGVMDLAAATQQTYELSPMPVALAGRLVALWLLWLVVVEIPIFGRQLGLSWQRLAGSRLAVAVLTALATGGFVWIWTLAATVLVRPVFTWSSLPSGVRLEAIQPVQTEGLAFAIVGGLVAGLVALARGPARLVPEPAPGPGHGPPRGSPALPRQVAGRVVVAALLTVSLGGLISVPLEAVALFAALAGARPLARFVADRTVLGTIVGALPPIARYALAGALTFTVAQVTIAPLYTLAAFDSTGNVPQFFSVIIAVTIGIVMVELVTTPRAPDSTRVTVASSAGVVAVLVVGLLLLLLAAPATVLADNCAGLSDCWNSPFLAALTGGALPLAMAAANSSWNAYRRWATKNKYEQKTERAVLGVRG